MKCFFIYSSLNLGTSNMKKCVIFALPFFDLLMKLKFTVR